MPARSKGRRLYLRPARHDKTGHHAAIWIIRDGNHQQSTGCPAYDVSGAERALALYITNKHVRAAGASKRDPGQIPIADILAIYLRDVVSRHSRPKETKSRIKALDSFFGDKLLSYVTGETCRAYVAQRPHRQRWLTRSEAARLIRSAWRYREVQKGKQTDRRSRQHVARFILVALYTGTRASAVCGAALQATVGHGWVD